MRVLALAAALALPGAALATDPTVEVAFGFVSGYAWFDGPGRPSAATSRIRIVSERGQGHAAMTLNQLDAYKTAYRRHLARYGMQMPMQQAVTRARRDAWQEVLGANDVIRVDDMDLRPLGAGALPTVSGN